MSTSPVFSASVLSELWKRGREILGCDYAVMGGAMTWVSERNLVSAISNAGGFGVLACGSMSPDLLRQEIAATQSMTDRNFGVNLIIMHPKLEELLQVCIDSGVSTVVLAGGIPSADSIDKLKSEGVKVLAFVPSTAIGKRLIKMGINALIIEGSEAGGHIGPVSTSVLAQEILPEITEVPVFVAGGIGRGETIVSYLQMGAAGVQLGTRFVCASESIAHAKFKRAFIAAKARDAMPSVQLDIRFPVIPVRALVNDAAKAFMQIQSDTIRAFNAGSLNQNEAQLRIEHFWAGALRRAVIDGDIENGSLMAGQSVGMVKRVEPVTAIVQELLDQAIEFLQKQSDQHLAQPLSHAIAHSNGANPDHTIPLPLALNQPKLGHLDSSQ